MKDAAVVGGFLARIHAVVPQDGRDAQAVVGEQLAPAAALCRPVGLNAPPGGHRLFVAPEGEGQDLAGLAETLEPLDGEKTVDAIEEGVKIGGDVEIVLAALVARQDFENHGDHEEPSAGEEKRQTIAPIQPRARMQAVTIASGVPIRSARAPTASWPTGSMPQVSR